MGQAQDRRTGWRAGRGTLAGTLAGMLAAGTLVLALGAPAAAGKLEQRTGATGAAATTAHVKIVDFSFKPGTLRIARGTRVVWTDRGGVSHTTTSNTGVWDSGTLAPGESFGRTFRKAGTFRYHCSIHSSMTGRIVVG